MNGEEKAARVGRRFAGAFLLVLGACLVLIGGGCAMIWIGGLSGASPRADLSGPGLLILSILALGIGVLAVVKGAGLLRDSRARSGRRGSSDGA